MKTTQIKEIGKFIRRCKRDWNVFAADVLEANLDREQQDILSSVQFNPKVAVASGTARGKDYTAAVAALCFLYLTPRWNEKGELIENTKVFATGPTERQMLNIVMPEISRLFGKMQRNGFHQILGGKLTSTDIKMPDREHFLTAFKSDDNSTENWSGLHAAHTMFIVTEATGVSETIYNSLEGNLQQDSRLLLVFNPNVSTGYAADALRSERFKAHRLDSLTAPNVLSGENTIPGQVDRRWVEERIAEWCTRINPEEYSPETEGDFTWTDEFGIEAYYRPSDLFRVKVRGMFPKVSEDVLVPGEWIEAANARHEAFVKEQKKPGKSLRLAVDVAGMGTDSSIFCHRYGNYIEKFEALHGGGQMKHMEVVGRILTTLRSKANGLALIDTIGEGAGVYDRLQEIAEGTNTGLKSNQVHSVKASSAPEWEGETLRDVTGQREFLNMRAYMYWAVRDWLNPVNNTGAMLPKNELLQKELMETKWKIRSDGKIQIEAKDDIKKRIKRSPDHADALALSFYPVKDHDVLAKEEEEQQGLLDAISSWL